MKLAAVAVTVAAVVVAGLVTAAAFAVLGLALDGIPHPLWGFAGGAALALLSYARTGWVDRRGR